VNLKLLRIYRGEQRRRFGGPGAALERFDDNPNPKLAEFLFEPQRLM
jgi:hypothetical protein